MGTDEQSKGAIQMKWRLMMVVVTLTCTSAQERAVDHDQPALRTEEREYEEMLPPEHLRPNTIINSHRSDCIYINASGISAGRTVNETLAEKVLADSFLITHIAPTDLKHVRALIMTAEYPLRSRMSHEARAGSVPFISCTAGCVECISLYIALSRAPAGTPMAIVIDNGVKIVQITETEYAHYESIRRALPSPGGSTLNDIFGQWLTDDPAEAYLREVVRIKDPMRLPLLK